MIFVNGKPMEWHDKISFREIYRSLGYTISDPVVNVVVNGELVKKSERAGFVIPDGSEIKVVSILSGG
jgi:thiamine biosynthesis protein ThiS